MILRNKKFSKNKKISATHFNIFLESFETHFDLVASKFGEKLNNLVIHDDILAEKILSSGAPFLGR